MDTVPASFQLMPAMGIDLALQFGDGIADRPRKLHQCRPPAGGEEDRRGSVPTREPPTPYGAGGSRRLIVLGARGAAQVIEAGAIVIGLVLLVPSGQVVLLPCHATQCRCGQSRRSL